MRHCSIPEIFNLRKWFEKNFGYACEYHDAMYRDKTLSRFEADVLLVKDMKEKVKEKSAASRAFVYYPVVAATFVAVRLFGWTRY